MAPSGDDLGPARGDFLEITGMVPKGQPEGQRLAREQAASYSLRTCVRQGRSG
jgi:hypothetical protein